MVNGFREYLRSLATGNGCEVILPWFPEHDADKPGMWLIRETRGTPKGPAWLNYPLAFLVWMFLSFFGAIKSIRKDGSEVKEISGLSRCRQFGHMLRLAWFRNVSPLNYKECHFYDADFRKEAELYIPQHRQGILTRRLNAGRPTESLDHKVQFYQTMKAAGLPVAEIIEVFHAGGRREFGKSDEELSGYLGQDFFIKPVNLYMGINTARWEYDDGSETYSDGNGTVVAAREFWAHIEKEADELAGDIPEKQARLVQPLIVNHADIADLSKRCMNTLRMNMVCFPDGHTEIQHVGFHMALGDEVANVRAIVGSDIDMETGCLVGANDKKCPGRILDDHPTTGVRVKGKRIPMFKESLELVERAHKTFPQNPIIGWDVAITPDGPILMEANCNPSFAGIQYHDKEPITRSQFIRLYEAWLGKS